MSLRVDEPRPVWTSLRVCHVPALFLAGQTLSLARAFRDRDLPGPERERVVYWYLIQYPQHRTWIRQPKPRDVTVRLLDFGKCVFHDCVSIRKAVRHCQPGARRSSRRSSSSFPPLLLQCRQCRTRGWGWLPHAQVGCGHASGAWVCVIGEAECAPRYGLFLITELPEMPIPRHGHWGLAVANEPMTADARAAAPASCFDVSRVEMPASPP
jgi:hypothetical protein